MTQSAAFGKEVRLPLALTGGVLLAIFLWRMAALASESGQPFLASVLYWQDTLMQGYALAHQGKPDDPSPMFFRLANLPVGIAVYSVIIYALLWLVSRRQSK